MGQKSRMVKLDSLTYDRLMLLKGPRDTFSDVVRRLLAIRADDKGIVPQLDTLTMAIRDLTEALTKTSQGG